MVSCGENGGYGYEDTSKGLTCWLEVGVGIAGWDVCSSRSVQEH